MKEFSQFMPIGSVQAHHMSEEYYATWGKLYLKERWLNRKMIANADYSNRWLKASQALTAHENKHCTD